MAIEENTLEFINNLSFNDFLENERQTCLLCLCESGDRASAEFKEERDILCKIAQIYTLRRLCSDLEAIESALLALRQFPEKVSENV